MIVPIHYLPDDSKKLESFSITRKQKNKVPEHIVW